MSGEASSLAGTQRLGNLTLIYDSNRISIEDDTNIALSEDVAARYEAYGWHVQTVDWTHGDTSYVEDVAALDAAITAAEQVTDRPSFIQLKTIIAWPTPKAQGTGGSHGSALGDEEIAATKELLGFDPEQTFEVPDEVLAHTRGLVERGQAARAEWQTSYDAWAAANPEGKALHDRLTRRELPAGWRDALPVFEADPKGVATRAASGKVLAALAAPLPELWGGSADLAGSNNTTMAGEPSFLPDRPAVQEVPRQPVRPDPALRHPRARHGLDHERHRRARRHPPLRRHVPGLLRLHARRGPPVGADADPGHLRVDPRLHRRRRGRPDPPADRARRRPAGHPRTGRGPPRPTATRPPRRGPPSWSTTTGPPV